jgi:hypothetical protein
VFVNREDLHNAAVVPATTAESEQMMCDSAMSLQALPHIEQLYEEQIPERSDSELFRHIESGIIES